MPSRAKPPSRKAARKPEPRGSTRAKAKAQDPAARPAAAPPAEGEPKNETAISASRGLVDFLRTHRLSFALTSYQTGQLMLIGVLPDGRLSVFQRNFVRAMGLCAGAQRIYVSAIAQVWRLESLLPRLPPWPGILASLRSGCDLIAPRQLLSGARARRQSQIPGR